MKNKPITIIGFLIIGIFILTSGKGINLKKLDDPKYLYRLYENGKKIIIKESSKTIENSKKSYLLGGK